MWFDILKMPTDRERYGEHQKTFIDGKWVKGRKLSYDDEGNLQLGGSTTYMVKDNIWSEAQGEGLNTILELEQKLGRKLTLVDFTDAPVNWDSYQMEYVKNAFPKEHEILMDRIGGEVGRKELSRQYLTREGKFPSKSGKQDDKVSEAQQLLGDE